MFKNKEHKANKENKENKNAEQQMEDPSAQFADDLNMQQPDDAAEAAAAKAAETLEKAEEEAKQEKEEKKKDPAAEIEELKLKLAEADKKYLLALADMDNFRKRCAKDIEANRYNVTADTIYPFLQVFDHFSMAVKASTQSDNLQSLLQGMKMIQDEFDRAFSELGVQCIDATGKDFDPNLHEAVSQEASDTVPAGKVICQWNCGYKIGTRLLKPAMVVVSSGKKDEAKDAESGKPEEKKEDTTEK